MNENPIYQVPVSPEQGGIASVDVTLNSKAQQYLDQTLPWVRFISILTFVCAGLMILAGFGMMLAGMAGRLVPAGVDVGPGSFPGTIAGVFVGLIYLVMAPVYIAPGVFLSRYATAIKFLRSNRTAEALENALKHQKSFWRYIGIVAVVGLVIMVLGLVVFLIVMSFLLTRRF